MADKIALIAIDWGTTNRRAWALTGDGRVIDHRADGLGLLSVPKHGFQDAFAGLTEGWRAGAEPIPVLMCGMVGSKLGWVETPYVRVPADIDEFAGRLCEVPGNPAVWIVPGACDEQDEVPDVMRGEECQILGALLRSELKDSIFLLPGTHSKWAVVENRRLVRFRTYMTGEMFNLLRGAGTIAQLIKPGGHDKDAFAKGLGRISDGGLLHTLFGARTLCLFDRLKGEALASYLSGILIGAEFANALQWAGRGGRIVAVGSPQLLANYSAAARQSGCELSMLDSDEVLPRALHAVACSAGLFR